jgi:hypothetical protein
MAEFAGLKRFIGHGATQYALEISSWNKRKRQNADVSPDFLETPLLILADRC